MIDKNYFNGQTYTWLITGVAGFIGSHLLEKLLNLNQKVVGLDNFSTSGYHNIELALKDVPEENHKNFVFYEGDVSAKELCEQAMQQVDFVLHQAAVGSIAQSIKEVALTHESNVNGFFNILLAAKEASVQRVVYASSCAIYGNNNSLPNNEAQGVDILSPYNASKYMNEIYAKTFSVCYGLETIGLRYFNIYGPRQSAHSPYAAVIPRWVNELLEKKLTYIHDVIINREISVLWMMSFLRIF